MKKTIAIILSLSLMINIFIICPIAYAEASENDLSYLISKLTAVGAVSSVTHEADDLVTRGEFVSAVAELFNLNVSGAEQVYYDVDSTNPDFGAVYALYASGAISLPGDRLFNPYANITCSEAAKILVSMLGYSAKAQAEGGYPTGYLAVASWLKINLTSYRDGLSYYNMLIAFEDITEVKIPVMESFQDGYVSYETREGITVLSEYHDIYQAEGVVEAVGINSLYGNEDLTSDKVSVGGITYYSEYAGMYDLLGCNVVLYYRLSDTRKTVVYAETEDADSIFEIAAEDIESYSGGIYRYYTENGKLDTAKVDSVPFVLYNGKTATGKNKNMYTPANGSVRLVDSDSDRVYDVIIINDYRTIVVEAVDAQNSVIYGKGGPDDILVFGEEEGIDARITTANEKDVFLGVIGEWNIISALVSEDGKYVRGIVSTSSVAGKLESFYDDAEGSVVTIGGEDYAVSGEISSEDIPSVGTEVVCYLDFEGRVAAVVTKESTEYGYYVMMDYIRGEGLDYKVKIKVKNADNDVKEYTLSEDTKIDGIREKTADDQYDALENGIGSGYIVRIRLDGEAVVDIDTPYVSAKEYTDSTLSPYLEKTENLLYKNSGNVEDKFYITDSTFLVFEYPGLSGDERYLVANRKMLANDTRNTVTAYAVGETFVPQAAIFEFANASGAVSSDSVYVVADKRKAEDPNGSMENKLSLMSYSSNMELYVSNQHIEKLGGIDVGDIIRFDAYKGNYVLSDFIRKVYDYSDDRIVDTALEAAGTNAMAAARLGYAHNKIDSYVSYASVNSVDDIAKADKAVTVIPANIIKISTERDKVVVTNGSAADIKDYKSYGNNCSRLFIKFKYRVPYEFVIIER